MIFNTFTAYAVTQFAGRKCVRWTELADVICAVFESGRPQFISKRKLHADAVRRECRNDGRLQAEWKLGKMAQVQTKVSPNLNIVERRVQRAGFESVRTEGNKVMGQLPADKFDARVALQVARENGWAIVGNQVIAA